MQINVPQLSSHLQRQFPRIILIFGDEPQQVMEALDTVRRHAVEQGFDERQSFVQDGEFAWESLLDACQSMSLFSAKQLIELNLPTGKPGAAGGKMLQHIASLHSDDSTLVVYGPKAGRDVQNSKWFKTLTANGVFVPCYTLSGSDLIRWVEQQLHHKNLRAPSEASAIIANACEGNMLAAQQEVEKLALLFGNDAFSTEQCQQAVVDQSRFTVFQLIDDMLLGEVDRVVKLLLRLESEGVEPNAIIWALIKEYQLLSQLHVMQHNREAINWQRLGIWRQKQPLYEQALRRIPTHRYTQISNALRHCDFRFKSEIVAKPFVMLCHLCLMFASEHEVAITID